MSPGKADHTVRLGASKAAILAGILAVLLIVFAIINPPAEAQGRGALTGLTLSSESPGQLVISWDAPDPAPTDYRVAWARSELGFLSYRFDNEKHRGNEHPAGDRTSITPTGLQKGATYKAHARTRHQPENGPPWSGPWTEVVSARVKDDPPPAPTGLTTSSVTHNQVRLAWNAATAGSVTGYRILRGTTADSLETLEDDTGSRVPAYTDGTVAHSTTYFYAVIAIGMDGISPQSSAATATTTNPPPAAPTGPTTTASHDQVSLSWTDPDDDAITGYQVWRGASADRLSSLVDNTDSDAAAYVDNTVSAETTYAYAVSAISPGGTSSKSGTASVATPAAPTQGTRGNPPIPPIGADPWEGLTILPDSDPPDKPTGLSVTLTDGKAVLTWTDPGSEADVTGYKLYRSFHIDYLTDLYTSNEKITTFTDRWPSQGEINVYVIEAFNEAGDSDQSDPAYIAPPAIPVNLSATVGMSSVTLSWEQPEMLDWVAETDPVITGYQILRGDSPNDLTVLNPNTGSDTTSYEDTTTRPAGGVHYAVRAQTAVGLSLPSQTLEVGTPDLIETHDGNSLTLASNWQLGRTGNTVTVVDDVVSEPFHTGPSDDGYTLETLKIDLAEVTGQPDLNVSVHVDNDGAPGHRIHSLSPPATLATGENVFTAPANARLEPDTRYWVVFRRTSESTGQVKVRLSRVGANDHTAARGFQLFKQNSFEFHQTPIRLTLTGQDRDDIPADATTTANIRVGQTVQSNVHGYGDLDWFLIRLQAGIRDRFDDVVGPNDHATVLAIYDSTGQRQSVSKILIGLPEPLRRVYFTPSASGDYYISAGVTAHANIAGDNHGPYSIRALLGDPETENVRTGATASTGSPYHGDLYTPHGSDTDTDWVRIPMNAGQRHQIILVADPRVKTTINNIYGPDGEPIADFQPVSSLARKPLFSTDPETGAQVLTGYQQGGAHTNGSWLETIFDPSTSGNHYIELTGAATSYRQGPQLGHDGQPLPGATASIVERDYHGTDYRVSVWSSGQDGQNDPSGTDTATQDALTPTRLNPQGDDTQGHINHAGDTDWFATWMEPGREYAIILDAKSTDASIARVLELPWPDLNLPGHHSTVTRESTGVANCYVHVHRPVERASTSWP